MHFLKSNCYKKYIFILRDMSITFRRKKKYNLTFLQRRAYKHVHNLPAFIPCSAILNSSWIAWMSLLCISIAICIESKSES